MSTESDCAAAVPLTSKELEEIAEYEKIVKFRDDVLAGRHPRIKVKLPRQLALSEPSVSLPAARTGIAINFRANYYMALGINPRTNSGGIERAFQAKMALYSPSSVAGNRKWKSESSGVRRRVERDYQRAVEAHQILSDLSLRQQYDAGRILPSRAGPNNSSMSWREQIEAATRES